MWANKNRRVSNRGAYKRVMTERLMKGEKEGEKERPSGGGVLKLLASERLLAVLREGCRNRRLESLRTLIPFSRPPHR